MFQQLRLGSLLPLLCGFPDISLVYSHYPALWFGHRSNVVLQLVGFHDEGGAIISRIVQSVGFQEETIVRENDCSCHHILGKQPNGKRVLIAGGPTIESEMHYPEAPSENQLNP